jgi:squalene-hopene/tetraprenyl-beta-curcumene cyclase
MSSFGVVQTAASRRIQVRSTQQGALAERLAAAGRKAADALLELQSSEGFWCGELTADSTLESDYILLQLWLHPPEDAEWNPPSRRKIDKAVKAILDRQLPDGGWEIFPGGGAEVNATARAYTACKIAGVDPAMPAMVKAKERVLALGGLQACNSYTKINFSLFGLFPRKYAPSVPPETVLLPGDILYEMSSWTRAILVPLSIVQAVGKHRHAPTGITVEELFHPDKKLTLPSKALLGIFFKHLDKVVKLWEKRGFKNVRQAAVREAEHWILDRTRYSDGLGAIYPSMMYFIMALDSLGYPEDHPDLIEGIRQFDNLLLETEDRFQFQPCVSPVWDTAIAAFALGELGQADPARITKAIDWILTKEVRRKGDWSVKRPDLEPGGWAFEFNNEYYPDIDDTAMVLLAFQHGTASDPEKQRRAEKRAINWLFGMQSSDGGWAAFDVDNNWQILNKVPFADHNAMLDPTCPDITGRVLEALGRRGFVYPDPNIKRAVEWLLAHQEEDGSWYGRWGVNYLYGTFLALRGLRASGANYVKPVMQKAADFLHETQNADGGWGESCASYKKGHFVAAPSTASQTAWALLGLAAAGDTMSAAVGRGVDFLVQTQGPDGRWKEPLATGTGFPNVFYLTYHMYRDYFPLLALGTLGRRMRG